MSVRSLQMTAAEAGQRLDRYLRKLLRDVPLGAIMRQLRSGGIRVDGARAEPSLRLEAGMTVELRLPAADLAAVDAAVAAAGARPSGDPRASAPDLRIVHADEDVLVVQKPSGLAVHGGTGNERASVAAWLAASGRGQRTATFAPAPAHRLDRETSGLVAIGLSPRGLQGLVAAFRDDAVDKVYVAVVEGRPEPAQGRIVAPLLVVPAASGRAPKVVVDGAGRAARTDYETIATGPRCALLRLRLHTGRMHQIRAHLAHLGCPVVGDRRYGRGGGRRLLLHAAELAFVHPVTGLRVRCTAPVPPEFRAQVGT